MVESLWKIDLGNKTKLPVWTVKAQRMSLAADSCMKRLIDPSFNDKMDGDDCRFRRRLPPQPRHLCRAEMVIARCSAMAFPFEAMHTFEVEGRAL